MRKQTPNKDAQYPKGTRSVYRAIALLKYIARQKNNDCRLSTLSAKTGLSPSTVHRLLSVLVQEGLLIHDPVTKCYRLGIEPFSMFSSSYEFNIREKFRTALERIALKTQDSVFLLIPSGVDALCVDIVEGKFPIRALTLDIGARRPMGYGVGSVALCAFLPIEEIEDILAANALRYSHHKKLTIEDVRKVIFQARQLGYAFSEEYFVEGVSAIAMPAYNSERKIIASVSVSAIPKRMKMPRREEVVDIVKEEIANLGPMII